MIVWRLTAQGRRDDAFSGEGAFRNAGRWHRAGTHLVYAASRLSLAALEQLVRFSARDATRSFFAYRAEIPDPLIERNAEPLPKDWRAVAQPPELQKIGSAWVASRRTLALLVPSAVIPEEDNVLLNPLHPQFGQVRIENPSPFRFDQRLVSTFGARQP
jgi:RES domain-containing protein